MGVVPRAETKGLWRPYSRVLGLKAPASCNQDDTHPIGYLNICKLVCKIGGGAGAAGKLLLQHLMHGPVPVADSEAARSDEQKNCPHLPFSGEGRSEWRDHAPAAAGGGRGSGFYKTM